MGIPMASMTAYAPVSQTVESLAALLTRVSCRWLLQLLADQFQPVRRDRLSPDCLCCEWHFAHPQMLTIAIFRRWPKSSLAPAARPTSTAILYSKLPTGTMGFRFGRKTGTGCRALPRAIPTRTRLAPLALAPIVYVADCAADDLAMLKHMPAFLFLSSTCFHRCFPSRKNPSWLVATNVCCFVGRATLCIQRRPKIRM
jgi:hypothetical protein